MFDRPQLPCTGAGGATGNALLPAQQYWKVF